MKVFFFCVVCTLFCLVLSGVSASASVLSANSSGSSVTLDLGIVISIISIMTAIVGVVVGILRISAVFESIRTRLTVIEKELQHIPRQLDGDVHDDEPQRQTRPPQS